MNKELTIEGRNQLIAEFMNRKPEEEYWVSDGEGICFSPKNIGIDWPPQQKQECERFLHENHGKGRLLEYSTKKHEWFPFYNKNWNELMPVVQKIFRIREVEDLVIRPGQTYIIMKNAQIFQSPQKPENDMITETWLCVIQFIQWYNSQSKQGGGE